MKTKKTSIIDNEGFMVVYRPSSMKIPNRLVLPTYIPFAKREEWITFPFFWASLRNDEIRSHSVRQLHDRTGLYQRVNKPKERSTLIYFPVSRSINRSIVWKLPREAQCVSFSHRHHLFADFCSVFNAFVNKFNVHRWVLWFSFSCTNDSDASTDCCSEAALANNSHMNVCYEKNTRHYWSIQKKKLFTWNEGKSQVTMSTNEKNNLSFSCSMDGWVRKTKTP